MNEVSEIPLLAMVNKADVGLFLSVCLCLCVCLSVCPCKTGKNCLSEIYVTWCEYALWCFSKMVT